MILTSTIRDYEKRHADDHGVEVYPIEEMGTILKRTEEVLGGSLNMESKLKAGLLMDGKYNEVFRRDGRIRSTVMYTSVNHQMTILYLVNMGRAPE